MNWLYQRLLKHLPEWALRYKIEHRPMPFKSNLPFGVNIAGYLRGQFGLGVAARSLINELQAAGIPIVLNNVDASGHSNVDPTFDIEGKDFSDDNPYAINLIHISPKHVPEYYVQKGPEYFRDRYNIAFWYWELPEFPPEWIDRLAYFHEIWVASRFCLESISKVAMIPVVNVGCSISIDERKINHDRSRFDLSEDGFVFLFAFDFFSQFERKNPLGVVEAFKRAFDEKDNVTLVLKSINSKHDPENYTLLKHAIEGLNVKMIDSHLNRDDLSSLMSTIDCYVSLHRSEGLGLTMAESMYLGKPVIATGYSGNTDFMNVNNSLLVRYQLIPLDRDYAPYRKGNIWAEPDISHASELMRLVYEDPESCRKMGEQGYEDIRIHLSPATNGQRVRSRLLRIAEDLGYNTDPQMGSVFDVQGMRNPD